MSVTVLGKLPDFTQFLEFMQTKHQNLPTAEHLKLTPYPEFTVDTDWEN